MNDGEQGRVSVCSVLATLTRRARETRAEPNPQVLPGWGPASYANALPSSTGGGRSLPCLVSPEPLPLGHQPCCWSVSPPGLFRYLP